MTSLTQQLHVPSIYRQLDETEEEDGDEIDPPTLRVELHISSSRKEVIRSTDPQ